MPNIIEREQQSRTIVSSKMKQINALVGGDEAKASAYASALITLTANKGLAECDPASIIDVGFQIVQAGLNPNPLFNEAYVVPFNLKDGNNWIKSAQLQVGVKGYITLAYRAGWVVKARAVYECDEFKIDMSEFDEMFTHIPDLEKQDNTNPTWVFKNIRGVIVMARDNDGNTFKEFVPNAKLEQIRLKSQNQKDPKKYTYIWADWSEEMLKAKAVKYVLKRLPISDTFMKTVIDDEAFERDHKDIQEIKKTIDALPSLNSLKGNNNAK